MNNKITMIRFLFLYVFFTLFFSFNSYAIEADIFSEETTTTPKKANTIGKAISAFTTAQDRGNFTQQLNPNELRELPIGIVKTKNSVEYGIVVTKAKFTPEYAIIDVFARVRTPQQGIKTGRKDLYFGAEGIKLSYSGRIIGDTKLALLGGDIHIPFNNNKWMLTLEGGTIDATGNANYSNTYVIIDCEGIKELSLKGNIQISRDVLTPLESSGKIAPLNKTIGNRVVKNRVRGDFNIKASDWNDLLVKINLPPFAITAHTKNSSKGYFSFMVNEAILDLSDLRNDPVVVFPEYYMKNDYLIAGTASWRGLFVKTFQIGLPEEFKTSKNPDKIIHIGANNLIIDNYGVSGNFYAENIFPIEEGMTAKNQGWAYSLDKIGIDLASSRIVGANIEGTIRLPIQGNSQKKDSKTINALAYKGMITEEEYLLNITIKDTINFNVWSAKANIADGSSIEMNVRNKTFYPRAILNGNLNISANKEENNSGAGTKKLLNFKNIKFEGLTLQTRAPYISIDRFEIQGKQQLLNFPVSIKDVVLENEGNKANLGFGISVGLQDKGFAALGRLHIQGEIKNNGYRQKWKYKGVNISKLSLSNTDIGVGVVSGELELMRNDPLYGNGFKAFLALQEIRGLPDVQVKVDAIFGHSTFRYWGFEGSVDGLNIDTQIIKITGFTGGAFYHMIPDRQRTKIDQTRALVFQPDKDIGLALRAGVYGALKNKKVGTIMAGFNISTNSNGGLANVGFMGEAHIMSDLTASLPDPLAKTQEKFKTMVSKSKLIDDLKEHKRLDKVLDVTEVDDYYPAPVKTSSAIEARIAMNYDFNNKVFHGELEVFVNTPGGLVTGTGRQGRAGWAVIHTSPKDWYLYIGTPTDMIGLKVGIGSFYVKSGSYFMVGTQIPGSPPPPTEVAEILGLKLKDIDYMKDLNSLSKGKGFAFGTHFKFDTGDMTALFLYARFKAGIGGDVMLKNYGKATCSNRGGDKIGINGWYANGQAYAYLQGELGIKIKLFFIRKKIPIIKAGAAALLQAKGPNPFWIRGYLGGHYNLLGGLVKGKFRFKLEFGEECKLANESVLGGMKIITDVTPQERASAVDIFAVPQATFAFRVNKPIVIPEDDGDHIYKILIDKFTIVDEKGNEIPGTIKYEKIADVANFVSSDILPPNKKLKVIVQVSFLEKKNGLYRVLTVDGKKATEREERSFVTGEAPTTIPLRNILYAYPVLEQHNFYCKQTNKGYIKLERGQDYLFNNAKWNTLVEFRGKTKTLLTDFKYHTTTNEIEFTLPDLKNSTTYNLGIVSKAKKQQTNKDTTQMIVRKQEHSTGKEGTQVFTSVATKKAKDLVKEGTIERLVYPFRTSAYNTFINKIKSLHLKSYAHYIRTGLYFIQNGMKSKEYFDIVELTGSGYTQSEPLIKVEALMNDTFANKFKQLIYNNYPVDGITLDRANKKNSVGIPPRKALPIISSYLTYLDKQKWNPTLKNTFPFRYDLFRYYSNDWYEMVCKALNKYHHKNFDAMPGEIKRLVTSKFGVIPAGKYKVKISYVLPGNKKSFSTTIDYKIR